MKRKYGGYTPKRPEEVEQETWKKMSSDKGVRSQVTSNLLESGKDFFILFFEEESLQIERCDMI